MSSSDDIDEVKARLTEVERQARNTRGWLIFLGVCVLVSLFGDSALRYWQISSVCNAIVAENPDLEHTECMRRVNEAWSNGERTIRSD